ncbi:type II restriction endonuclease [Kiloniella antarctica]|uniref:Type II restriction endonuclease n=1 Tax=Kiloniella antarctica TaxID=1550907 RepID=A0ABW5BJP7_9PROT
MSQGLLANYFTGICAKRLSRVEIESSSSNQHEFNVTRDLKKLLGKAEPVKFQTSFLYLDDENDPIKASEIMTWYDSRRNNLTRSEYRLYYRSTIATKSASAGDTLILAREKNGEIFAIIAASGSTIERQLLWLFGLPPDLGTQFSFEETKQLQRSDFITRLIFDALGIVIAEDPNDIELILSRFGDKFPTTRQFSEFARENTPSITDYPDSDSALISWMNREELLFRQLEKYIVSERLKEGFVSETDIDVDGFISFSLSVQNRRKSRVGLAFENHLEEIFIQSNIKYTRGAITENREKPDFIFPGIEEYRSSTFPSESLSMLGVKTTCKDRWRQVLTEAKKVNFKHLVTLEPAISEHQTNQMEMANLQLVLPQEIHQSYNQTQQSWLINLESFIQYIHSKKQSP